MSQYIIVKYHVARNIPEYTFRDRRRGDSYTEMTREWVSMLGWVTMGI